MKRILLLLVCVVSVYTTSFAQDECVGPLTVTIEGSSSDNPLNVEEQGIVQPICGPTGSITIDITGGSPDYAVQWQKDGVDYSTDQNLTDLGTGTYTVVVTDDSGCSFDLGPFEMEEPDAMELTASTVDPNCNMEGSPFDGSIDIEVTNGTGPYTYAWSSDDGTGLDPTAQDQTGLSGGTFTVVVTDANNCTVTDEWTLTAPDAFDVTWTSEDPNCHEDNGTADGSIDMEPVGGVAPYDIEWKDADGNVLTHVDGDLAGLAAGTYDLAVTDANGCELLKQVTLESPTAIDIALTSTDPTCADENGSGGGTIDITVSGGSGTYTYAWTPDDASGIVADGSNQTGLSSGTYTVVVTDENGCSSSAEITLEGPDAIAVADAETVDPTCGGEHNGSITLGEVTGGTGPYTYSWNTNGGSGIVTTAKDQTELDMGEYTVTITDAEGCDAVFSWTLSSPEEIIVSVDTEQDLSCNAADGVADGAIAVSATGGVGTLTYAWTVDGDPTVISTSSSISDLEAGEYTVVVSDDNGCSAEQTITLEQPNQIQISEQLVSPDCGGESDGSIWIAITPADTGNDYTYEWKDGDGNVLAQTNKDLENVPAGTYTYTATNTAGCSITATYELTDPAGIVAEAEATEFNLCNGDANAEITITASGGSGTLQYSIDDGDTFQSSNVFSGLTAGTYEVVVEDANGCENTFDFTVEDPAQLTAGTCTEAQDLCNASEGEIKVQAAGGVAPYTVTWSSADGGTLDAPSKEIATDGGSVTFNGAEGGKTYSFVVTDANGCQIP